MFNGFSGKLIRRKFTRLRGGWSSGNLVHTSYSLTPPLSYCGQARRESLPTRQAGGYECNLDLWFSIAFAFDRNSANFRALGREKIYTIRLDSARGHYKIYIDGSLLRFDQDRNRYICESRSCKARCLLSGYWWIFFSCSSGYLGQSVPNVPGRWRKMISWWELRAKSTT